MIRLPKINNLSDELLTDQDIDRLQIQMHDFILDQMPYPVNDVEQQIDLGLERNGGASHLSKSIQWLTVDHLH